MQASSSAYRQADVFHRTVAQIEHGAHSYLVDIFRVRGGQKQEYVFHMPNMSHSLNEESDLKFTEPEQQEQVRFALHINIDDKTTGHAWIEVSDVVIQEEFINGSLGPNYAGDPFPSDIHGSAPIVLHIIRRAQEGIGLGASGDPVRLELPDKQQHLAPPLPVVNVPLSGG